MITGLYTVALLTGFQRPVRQGTTAVISKPRVRWPPWILCLTTEPDSLVLLTAIG